MRTMAQSRDAEGILTRLQRVSPSSERRWGRMTAHQMICHLADAFRMALDDRPIPHSGSWASRNIVKYLALYSPFPWPHGVKASPPLDQQRQGTRPVAFETDRNDLMVLIERMRTCPTNAPPPVHSMLGDLSWTQWKILMYRHCDHHLRQFGV